MGCLKEFVLGVILLGIMFGFVLLASSPAAPTTHVAGPITGKESDVSVFLFPAYAATGLCVLLIAAIFGGATPKTPSLEKLSTVLIAGAGLFVLIGLLLCGLLFTGVN